MKIEEYLERLTRLASEHPEAKVICTFNGDEYNEPFQWEPIPVWSIRDNAVWIDGDPEEDNL